MGEIIYDELFTAPILCSPCAAGRQKADKMESDVKVKKKGGVGGRSFSRFTLISHYSD